jgi:hypothetical protein
MLDGRQPRCTTNADSTKLSWEQGSFTKTVVLDKQKNDAIMTTKPGIKRYYSFATTVPDLEPSVCCFIAMGAPGESALVVTDDDGSDNESEGSSATVKSSETEGEDEQLEPVKFEAHPDVQGVSVKNNEPLSDNKQELYRLHVRAGHLLFPKIPAMARQGEVPSRLQHCKSRMCAACQYGKATRKPWRTKQKGKKIQPATKPGECVLVDRLESRQVGFVAQLKVCRFTLGRYRVARYRVATTFVNHCS